MKSLAQIYMDAGKSNLIVQLQQENASLKSQLEAMERALHDMVGWIKDDPYKAPEQPIEIIVSYSRLRDAQDALSAYRNTKEQPAKE